MQSVSVHIVTYNSEKDIEECLESVFNQTYPIGQIIIIDNGSRDSTAAILNRYADRVQLILNQENIGFAAAHNQAIRGSNSDYFLVLNPDVVLHPDYVKYLVSFLQENPGVGSATGKLLLKSNPGLIDSTGLLIKKNRRSFDRGSSDPAELWNLPSEVFGVSGAAAFYRRKMVDAVSIAGEFYDEDFFAYKEDVDVAWRSQLLGWKAAYVPEATATHERGWKKDSRQQQSVAIRKHSYINRYQMMLKNESLWFFLLHSPMILLYEITGFLYIVFNEMVLLSSWIMFFKNFPRLMEKRRWIKANRRVPYRQVYRFFRY